MKFNEIKELTVDEINQRIASTHKQLFELRFKLSLRQLENPASIAQLKHEIAQMKTALRQKELAQASGGR